MMPVCLPCSKTTVGCEVEQNKELGRPQMERSLSGTLSDNGGFEDHINDGGGDNNGDNEGDNVRVGFRWGRKLVCGGGKGSAAGSQTGGGSLPLEPLGIQRRSIIGICMDSSIWQVGHWDNYHKGNNI